MADVTLRVKTETRDAKSELERIQQLADALGAKKTTIKFDSKSVDGAAASLRSVKTEATKIKMDSGVFDAYKNGAISLDEALKSVQAETKKTSSVFSTLTQRFTAANLASAAITAGISALRNAIREAVTEMKEMDKELTTIKMVSGATSEEIDALRESAFTGAREMGRSVTDYLSAAERFTRAGYRDNIDELSKLSLMTQNIGGVEEDTAAKFLLAADAAWKLNGSYDALMGVLDGVSAVADQNATDLGKIAEGITIAGSAMANAGVSAKEFTAMLGVTTASTQRSGSEMARGLRTILFRVRQVKKEFDDGEIIDADAISKAAGALKDVADIDVFDKNGHLKDFMDIMNELADKWPTLSKYPEKIARLQDALAGSRNGNVLFALMGNWGQYEKMLQQYEDSEGTAIAKNEEATKSWKAEVDKLKTSWTELISTITANGELQKAFVEGLSDFVASVSDLLEWSKRNDKTSGFGAVTNGINEQALAHERANAAAEKAQRDGKKLTKTIKEGSNALVDYSNAADGATGSTDGLADSTEKVTTAFDTQRDKISEVAKAIKEEKNTAVDSLADIYKAAMEAADKGFYGSNAFRKGGGLFFSEESLAQIQEEGKTSAREYLDAYFREIESGNYSTAAANFFGKITEGSNEIKTKNGEILASVKDIGDGYQWTFDKGNRSMEEYLQSLEQNTGIGQAFWASMLESLGMYSKELASWEESNGKAKTEAQFEDEAAKAEAQSWIDLLNSIPPFKQTTVRTVYETSGLEAAQQAAKPKTYSWSGYGEYVKRAGGKHDNYSGIALVNDEFPADGSKPELIISKSEGKAYIANGGKPALVNLSSEDIVLSASETKSAFSAQRFDGGKLTKQVNLPDLFDGSARPRTSVTVTTPKTDDEETTGPGGKTKTDATEDWATLKKLVDYLLSKAKSDLDSQLAVLDEQLAELEAERKAQQESKKLQEKETALQQAQLDLEKAQSERTVRYYNEETQQWEWMADQGAVSKAQEAVDSAQKDLDEYKEEMAYSKKKEELEGKKTELQGKYDNLSGQWTDIVDIVEAPSGDIASLLDRIRTSGTSTMRGQSETLAGLLDSIRGTFSEGFATGVTRIGDNTEGEKTKVDTIFSSERADENGLIQREKSLGPDITSDILKDNSFDFSSLEESMKRAVSDTSKKVERNGSTIIYNNGGNTFVNGVKIGSDQVNKPFGEVMNTLSIHLNEMA